MTPAHACLAGALAAVTAVALTGYGLHIPTEDSPRLTHGWWYGRPARLPIVLLITAVTAAAFVAARRLQADPATIGYLATVIGGITLAIIDLRVRRLPYPLTGGLYAVCAVSLTANQLAHAHRPDGSLSRAAAATAIATTAFLVLALVFAGPLGLGDVAVVGLLAGMLAYRSWAAAALGLAAGLLLQLPAALLALARGQRGASFPLGSSLIVGWISRSP